MKIEISETIKKEVEIELPHYRKTSCHYYKIFSPDHCVQICTAKNMETIGIHHAGLAYNGPGHEDCGKEDFEKSFTETVSIIQSK